MRYADCHPDKKHVANGLCNSCYTKEYRAANPEKFIANRELSKQLLKERGPRYKAAERDRKFGLEPGGYDRMREEQNYKCAACGVHESELTRAMHVDHDHKCCPEVGKSCGKCVRGLLCHHCNVALGHLNDDLDRVMAIGAYLIQNTNVLEVAQNGGRL